jgi:gamma-glutamyltranspeptidase/glutathione hydrolase
MRRTVSLLALAACASLALEPIATAAHAESIPLGMPTPRPVSNSTPAKGMVAAANPLAVEAGLRVLRDGGSAVDAAVAIQAVLGLVEPQSSGLGGGSFMVFYDAKTSKVTAYDGREKAPSGASPDMFMGADGKPLPFVKALLSGRSSGVPGRGGHAGSGPEGTRQDRLEHAVQGCRKAG